MPKKELSFFDMYDAGVPHDEILKHFSMTQKHFDRIVEDRKKRRMQDAAKQD